MKKKPDQLDLSSALLRRIVGEPVTVQMDIAELRVKELMVMDDMGATFTSGTLETGNGSNIEALLSSAEDKTEETDGDP